MKRADNNTARESKMKKYSDTAVVGVLAGIVGGTAHQLFMWVFYLMGTAKITAFQLGAYVAIKPGLDITSIPAQLLGMLQHYALSTILAVFAFYCLQKIGTDYLLLKGLLFGVAVHFIVYGWLAKTAIPVDILQPDFATSVVFLFSHLVFGVASVLTLVKASAK